MKNSEKFQQFIKQKYNIPIKELDDFFGRLEPITIDEIIGEWRVGYLFTEGTGSKWETFIKMSPVKLYSKKFLDRNNVKAWIFCFLGLKFSLPMTSAILRMVNFRNKISTSMIYNYLPMLDHFRKVNDGMIMGIMEVKGRESVYFYLEKTE